MLFAAGKLRILGENQEAVLVDKSAIGDELFALGYDVEIDLGGWAFYQDGSGTLEYVEAIRRTLELRLADVSARALVNGRKGLIIADVICAP
ncbi:MAG: hypothetical protein FJ122_02170 [Deltaproteobacteria bacterium]|nr:hypothetical protein [Deltaproteobacteria bacterium]